VVQNEVEVAVQGEAAGEGVEVCEGIALEADQVPTEEQRIVLQ
jgi:hypothetical protein